ncbi:hypothetical protein [Geomonas azotofigens]|uniref:hypothetical protein n=1 Tax=Geomonas azotofigens TaxID=2843196 RepID=UPI001C119EB7|nr:hypothetical protein [Geomonas azotofigens]MBU5612992.1 hypothetical protein [Geomonas azotofigens]
MKEIALSLLLLLPIPNGGAWAEECDCQPVEYEQLMKMPAGELRIKMEQFARSKDKYAVNGSTYCFYTCATEYEHLGDALAKKEIDLVKARAARRAAERDRVLRPLPPSR